MGHVQRSLSRTKRRHYKDSHVPSLARNVRHRNSQRKAQFDTGASLQIRRHRLLLAGLVVGLVLAAMPVLLAFHLARQQAISEKFAQLDALATGFSMQVHDARQMLNVLAREAQQSKDAPCSSTDIQRLQRFVLSSRAVQSILRMQNGRIACSTAGDLMQQVRMGPTETIRGDGTRVFTNVQVPGLANLRYVVLQRGDYGLLIFPEALMAPFKRADITLAIFGASTGQIAAASAPLQPEWTRGMPSQKSTEHLIDQNANFMVVRKQVTADGSAVLVASPLSAIDSLIDRFSYWFIPLGVLLGFGIFALALRITRKQLSARAEMLMALRKNHFFLLYQPVFDLQNNTCIGAEALVRWRQEDGVVLSPDAFIPFAEDTGLIQPLTKRVLELVQQDMAPFLRQNRQFRLAINLSPHDLQSEQTTPLLAKLIEDVGPGCGQFMVEVTERGLLEKTSAADVINSIRDLGVEIAIDDFGTGYSSLSYLATYQFDVLKIDKAFTGAACTNAVTSEVGLHIIELGRTLGMQTLSEGIETQEQAELFRSKGVVYAQGYYFARPMPAADLVAFYQHHAPVSEATRPADY